MAEVSEEGVFEGLEIDEGDDNAGDEGSANDTGAYSNPDGTTGYAGTVSEEPGDFGDSEDYPASLGAALAVGGIAIELTGEGLLVGLQAPAWIGKAVMGADMVVELVEGFWH